MFPGVSLNDVGYTSKITLHYIASNIPSHHIASHSHPITSRHIPFNIPSHPIQHHVHITTHDSGLVAAAHVLAARTVVSVGVHLGLVSVGAHLSLRLVVMS